MKHTVVIAERNETDLPNTIASIKEHNKDIEIVVMSDKEGLGCQQMRHRGIHKANGDVITIMDAHMRVKPDTLSIQYDSAKKGKVIACAKCYHGYEYSWKGNPYCGADMVYLDNDWEEYSVLASKWRKDTSLGPMASIMGACYTFRKDYYIDGLNCPWQFGTGWGQDEEIISIVNWISGGENILTPAEIWHQARIPKQVPYKYSQKQLSGVFANRYRKIDMLPIPDEEITFLTNHLMRNKITKEMKVMILENLKQTSLEVQAFKNNLSLSDRTWQEFKDKWLNKKEQAMKPMTVKEIKKILNNNSGIPYSKLHKMKKPELVSLMKNGESKLETKAEVRTVRGVQKEGVTPACIHCGNYQNNRFHITYPNATWRWYCSECDKPYIVEKT